MAANPRYSNGHRRRELRKRVRAMGLPCAICGRPIDYTLTTYVDPRDGRRKPHPMSYELDEIVPVSKGGSPLDPRNVQPTHRICNQRKGAGGAKGGRAMLPSPQSRDW